jgi:hypothetical protein
MTILGQDGIAAWMSAALQSPDSGSSDPSGEPHSALFVATVKGTVRGAAEWRQLDDTLFLNGISVHPNHRGRGLGRGLLRRGLTRFDQLSHVALDVFGGNDSARRWYDRLGFRHEATRHWMICPLDAGINRTETASRPSTDSPSPSASLQNKSEADAKHDQFGFSTLHFATPQSAFPDASHRVGRLGTAYFRITDASTFATRPVRHALLEVNPSRSLLLLASAPSCPSSTEGVTCTAHSLRMTAPRSVVDAALSGGPDSP